MRKLTPAQQIIINCYLEGNQDINHMALCAQTTTGKVLRFLRSKRFRRELRLHIDILAGSDQAKKIMTASRAYKRLAEIAEFGKDDIARQACLNVLEDENTEIIHLSDGSFKIKSGKQQVKKRHQKP